MGRAFAWDEEKRAAAELLGLRPSWSVRIVAELLDVTPRTVQGWTRRDAFRLQRERHLRDYLVARVALREQAMAMANGGSGVVVDVEGRGDDGRPTDGCSGAAR